MKKEKTKARDHEAKLVRQLSPVLVVPTGTCSQGAVCLPPPHAHCRHTPETKLMERAADLFPNAWLSFLTACLRTHVCLNSTDTSGNALHRTRFLALEPQRVVTFHGHSGLLPRPGAFSRRSTRVGAQRHLLQSEPCPSPPAEGGPAPSHVNCRFIPPQGVRFVHYRCVWQAGAIILPHGATQSTR